MKTYYRKQNDLKNEINMPVLDFIPNKGDVIVDNNGKAYVVVLRIAKYQTKELFIICKDADEAISSIDKYLEIM